MVWTYSLCKYCPPFFILSKFWIRLQKMQSLYISLTCSQTIWSKNNSFRKRTALLPPETRTKVHAWNIDYHLQHCHQTRVGRGKVSMQGQVKMSQVPNILQKLMLSFHHMGSRGCTRVVSLGNKHLYPLIHLAGSYHFLSVSFCVMFT